jgi:hypothetical protein
MTKQCQHEADWDSTSVVDREYGVCSVGLVCLHCDVCAFADLGPEHFKWDDWDDASPGARVADLAEVPVACRQLSQATTSSRRIRSVGAHLRSGGCSSCSSRCPRTQTQVRRERPHRDARVVHGRRGLRPRECRGARDDPAPLLPGAARGAGRPRRGGPGRHRGAAAGNAPPRPRDEPVVGLVGEVDPCADGSRAAAPSALGGGVAREGPRARPGPVGSGAGPDSPPARSAAPGSLGKLCVSRAMW